MSSRSTGLARLKALLVIEAVALAMALVVPLIPRGSGRAFDLPATAAAYFRDVAVGFVLANAVLLAIAAGVWTITAAREPHP